LEAAQCFLPFLILANNIFIVKIFHHAIIDETGIYWPVGVEHDSLRRQREAKDGGKERTDDADLRP
jgi:hypothetical protein